MTVALLQNSTIRNAFDSKLRENGDGPKPTQAPSALILKLTVLKDGMLFILFFILFDFAPTNVGQGGHNSITNYCGPKNKY